MRQKRLWEEYQDRCWDKDWCSFFDANGAVQVSQMIRCQPIARSLGK